MWRFNKVTLVVLLPSLIALFGCEHLASIDKPSLLFPGLHRSEVFGILAGFGTTVAMYAGLDRDAQASIKCRHEQRILSAPARPALTA
jgi:hypothetical protein